MMLFSAKESGKCYVDFKGKKDKPQEDGKNKCFGKQRFARHTEAVGHRKDLISRLLSSFMA